MSRPASTSSTKLKRASFMNSQSTLESIDQDKFAHLFDYVLVFNMFEIEDPQTKRKTYHQTPTCKGILKALNDQGVYLATYLSFQMDEIYCLVRVQSKKLRDFAEKIKFPLEMDPAELEALFTGCVSVDGAVKKRKLPAEDPLTKFREKHKINVRVISDGVELKTLNPPIDPPSEMKPFQKIFLPYDDDVPRKLYKHADSSGDKNPADDSSDGLFTYLQRLKLTYYYLKSPTEDGGCGIQIEKLLIGSADGENTAESKESEIINKNKHWKLDGGILKACFPLHNVNEKEYLYNLSSACSTFPWNHEFHNELRNYFGEKLILFYVFVGHYSLFLTVPALIGVVMQIVVLGQNDYSHPALCFLGLVISVWSIVMLQYWKRKQLRQAMEWGMMDYEETEPDRPEFYGVPIYSMVNGDRQIYFPDSVKDRRNSNSVCSVISYIMLVIGVVSSIYAVRMAIAGKGDKNGKFVGVDVDSLAGMVSGVLNSLQIYFLNLWYQKIVVFLTEQENQRTDTAYEDSHIAKLFVFQFVNSYASFFYIAFVAQFMPLPRHHLRGDIGQCGGSTCMPALALNLFIVFGTRITINNFFEWYTPWSAARAKYIKETEIKKGSPREETASESMKQGLASTGCCGMKNLENDPRRNELSPPELDYVLTETNPMITSINNYADIAVQFGYVTMFATALPCSAVCALISNHVMLKVNTLKMIKYFQRPVPNGAEDIGTWESIFNFLAAMCVVTNAGLVSFTMDVLQRGTTERFYLGGPNANANFSRLVCVWVFIGFSLCMFLLQYLCDVLIEDVPDDVALQKERIAFFRSKLIEKEPDEDWDKAKQNQLIDEIVSNRLAKIDKSGFPEIKDTNSCICEKTFDFCSKVKPFEVEVKYEGFEEDMPLTFKGDYIQECTSIEAQFRQKLNLRTNVNQRPDPPARLSATETIGLEMQIPTPNPLLSPGGGRLPVGGRPGKERNSEHDHDPASSEFASMYGGGQ